MELIRVNKNGTEYYADYTCPRCGGKGGADAWRYTGYTCYKCGGTGKVSKPTIIKKYTPEYAAKLAEKAAKKAEKKKAERMAAAKDFNAKWLERNGFTPDGVTYCAIGNTYDIKEQLKTEGYKFCPELGWHTATPKDHDHQMITIAQFGIKNELGEITGIDWEANKVLKEATNNLVTVNNMMETKGFVGKEGEKVTFTVNGYKVLYEKSGPTSWIAGATVYRIVDTEGHVYIWSTTTPFKDYYWEDNKQIVKVAKRITATVKEHKEYKGEKQTVITRGKIEYEEV